MNANSPNARHVTFARDCGSVAAMTDNILYRPIGVRRLATKILYRGGSGILARLRWVPVEHTATGSSSRGLHRRSRHRARRPRTEHHHPRLQRIGHHRGHAHAGPRLPRTRETTFRNHRLRRWKRRHPRARPRMAGRRRPHTVVGSSERGGKGGASARASGSPADKIIGFVDADYKTPIEEIDAFCPVLKRAMTW